MSETIDLTIVVSESCGTCKHYKYRRTAYRGATPPELIERFKDVPRNNRGPVLGGYCLQNEKIRLTSRLAKCGAWERTTNKTLFGMFRRAICTHVWVLGCSEKKIAPLNLVKPEATEYDDQTYKPIVKYPYLRLATWFYCKKCLTRGPQEWNGVKGGNSYTVYLSKSISDYYKSKRDYNSPPIPSDWKMTPQDQNPDYYELADRFTNLRVGHPLPEGFEIKDSWVIGWQG